MTEIFRHYVVCKWESTLWNSYRVGDTTGVKKYIIQHVGVDFVPEFDVVGLPTNDVGRFNADHPGFNEGPPPGELVAALEFDQKVDTADTIASFQNRARAQTEIFVGSGADLSFSGSDHW